MKRNKKGISLITLVITIIVMTIISGVIVLTLSDTNIFNKANEAANKYNENDEIQYIATKVGFYVLEKDKTFYEYLQKEFGENNVKDNLDDTYTIILESGNSYIVWENGKVQPAKGIYIEATGIPLMLKDGETVTGTLKAILVDISGKITWSNENDSVVTISANSGESITVTAVAKGETKITASCNGYSREYIVKVSAPVPVGVYVEYDIPYTDMWSNIKYTKTNGWRYLGLDDDGNKLIISTAIPAIVNFNFKPGDTLPLWWATDAEVQADKGIYNTTAGWDYDNGGEPNKYAAYGLRYKFESIPFTYQASGTEFSTLNAGIFRQVGNTTSGTSINLNFRASGVAVEGVHNLTVAELNRAMNAATGKNLKDNERTSGFDDIVGEALGLFDMKDLTGYTTSYYYWLAFPHSAFPYFNSNREYVSAISSRSNMVDNIGSYLYNNGIRPVVVLSSDVEIIDTNADGIYEIT